MRFAIFTLMLAGLLASAPANASYYAQREAEAERGYAYARSYDGLREVTAPTRRVRLGVQVRLPGGTWVDCGATCEHTLQEQVVDFWKAQTDKGLPTGHVGGWLFGRY